MNNSTVNNVSANKEASWVCPTCGYAHQGAQPPEVCPLCGVSAENFIQE